MDGWQMGAIIFLIFFLHYSKNIQLRHRCISVDIEIAAEERLRRAEVQRTIGFRELNTQWPGEEGIRLAVLQRLTQFWNVKLFGQSHQKNFTGLYIWSRSSNLGKSALINTIAEIAYTFRHCTTDNGWQETFGYTIDHQMMYQAYLVDGLQFGKDCDYNIELISNQDVKIKRRYTWQTYMLKQHKNYVSDTLFVVCGTPNIKK